jgi:hypothetical protein
VVFALLVDKHIEFALGAIELGRRIRILWGISLIRALKCARGTGAGDQEKEKNSSHATSIPRNATRSAMPQSDSGALL